MKKNLFAFTAVVMMATASHAAVVTPVSTEPTPAVAKITAEQFSTMSVKEFQEVTGKKLNLAQKLAFKAAQKATKKTASSGKSQLTAVLLCFFLGGIGVHRFYMGYTWQGIVQILTLGGLGIWTLIDFIRLLTGSLQPKDSEWDTTL